MKSINMIINNIRFFIPIIKKVSPFAIIVTIISTILSAAYPFVWIIFIKLFIDLLLSEPSIYEIGITVLIYSGIVFIYNVINKILKKMNYVYVNKANYLIGEMLNEKIMHTDYFNIENPQFIDKYIMAKKGMTEYTSGIYSFVYTFSTIVQSILRAFGVVFIVLYSKEYLLIVVCVIGIILSSFIWVKGQKMNKAFNDLIVRYQRKQYYYSEGIAIFRNQKELRLFNAKKMVLNKSANINKIVFSKYKKLTVKFCKINFWDSFTSIVIINMFSFIILAISVYQKNLSISNFTLLINSVATLSNAVACIIFYFKKYSLDCKYQQYFIDLMNLKSVFINGKEKVDKLQTLEFRNVSFKYPRTKDLILDNVNFKINKNKKFSIVGLNGSGKTTIIKLLCRFYKVDKGEILVNGININELEYESYMKMIAVVFQDFKIISFSIKSNISILDDNISKLYTCLEKAQVLERVLSAPNRENTYINKWFDKDGIVFSGGEMQKFAIARTIYKEGQLIVLDEPTSALDPVSESKIYYNFNQIMGNVTTVFISHRLSSCRFCDCIIVLDGGKIVEEGNHETLIKNQDGLYHKMFTAQSKYYN